MQRVRAILALAAMALITAPGAAIAQVPVAGADTTANPYAAADQIFADYVLDAHIPGLVYGIVVDGRLVHVGTSACRTSSRSARSRATRCSASRR